MRIREGIGKIFVSAAPRSNFYSIVLKYSSYALRENLVYTIESKIQFRYIGFDIRSRICELLFFFRCQFYLNYFLDSIFA